MKLCKRILFLVVLCKMTVYSVAAQEKVLRIDELFAIIKQYHPLMIQTGINIEQADANLLFAKGNFDPTIGANATGKKLDDEVYYRDVSSELKVPLWYGMDIVSQVEGLGGTRTDPSQTLGGTSLIGVQMPLLNGLMMDKRRAAVLQAKQMQKLSVNDQRIIRNNLLIESAQAYWMWVNAYQIWQIMKQTVSVNELRLQLVKKSLELGERAAIDTIEAYSQLMNFQNQALLYQQKFLQAGVELSVYLWQKDCTPYILDPSVVPDPAWELHAQALAQDFNLDLLSQQGLKNHPEISIYKIKEDILKIDRQLKKQDLLPKLDLKYNFLAKSANPLRPISDIAPFTDNYNYGIKASMPIYFRQGKAQYKMVGLKLKENTLLQDFKSWEIQNKIRNYFIEYTQLKDQIKLQSDNVKNYQALVRGEELKMENGESSLFMINARENKELEAREKLIELKIKQCKAIYMILWSSGQLGG